MSFYMSSALCDHLGKSDFSGFVGLRTIGQKGYAPSALGKKWQRRVSDKPNPIWWVCKGQKFVCNWT